MGHTIAKEIAASPLSLEQKLDWHFTGNHTPPVDAAFIPVAMDAIAFANNGYWDAELTLPNELKRTVKFIVEGLHLQAFIPHVTVPEDEE